MTDSNPEYIIKCKSCTAKIKFRHSEAQFHVDHSEGDWVSVSCPVCRRMLTEYSKI